MIKLFKSVKLLQVQERADIAFPLILSDIGSIVIDWYQDFKYGYEF